MKLPLKSGWWVSVALALSLLVVAVVLALAACGSGSGETTFTVPSDLPSWPAGASPSPAVSYPPQTGTTADFRACTGGWEFRPYVDIALSALGLFDDSQDGLLRSHQVGIFETSSEHLIVSRYVDSQSTLDGALRWESVEPSVVLKAGKSYVVAWAVKGPPFDPEIRGHPSEMVWAAEIDYVSYRESSGSAFRYPPKSPYFFVTANFKFKPVSASSPSP